MRAAVVLHGEPPAPADLALLADCDLVVAADGAALHLFAAGVAPHLVVGDLDSLGEAGLREAGRRAVDVERHPPRKDRTDGELALEAALRAGPSEVLLLGAHGGRTAQFLGNLQLLRRCHDLGLAARMVGRGEEARFLGPGQRWDLAGRVGATVNVLPAGPGGARVVERGLGWSGAVDLEPGAGRGLSNPVVSPEASVEVLSGVALVVVEASA